MKRKMYRLAGVAGAAVFATSVDVYAALPAGLTTAMTDLTTDTGTLIDTYGWPLFIVIVGGLAMMGIARKVIGKVT
jgi:hypothetical protein